MKNGRGSALHTSLSSWRIMTLSEPIASNIDNDGSEEDDDEFYDNDKLNVSEEEKEAEEDCLLCLSSMLPYDTSHPIQCPSQYCQFNCCLSCLESIIKATKDHTVASDENTFLTSLHCPNCRSNLGPSIRDTVLLRKIDKYLHLGTSSSSDDGDGDDQLSASELRLKKALATNEDHIASDIDEARKREDDFFGRDHPSNDADGAVASSSYKEDLDEGTSKTRRLSSFIDEEGVEADITQGVHKSFIFRHKSQMGFDLSALDDLDDEDEEEIDLENVEPDPSLLAGLDYFLAEEEKRFITAQLTSGDLTKLAATAEMMHHVGLMALADIKPNTLKQRRKSISSQTRGDRRGSMHQSMLSSIKDVIRESNEARLIEMEKEEANMRKKTNGAVGITTMQLVNATNSSAAGQRRQKLLLDAKMKQQMEFMIMYPLPIHMPKYTKITVRRSGSPCITVVDDVWNGTVLDAFTKLTVKKCLVRNEYKIIRQALAGNGIRRVIDVDDTSKHHDGKGYIDTFRPRVIVAAIGRELGRQGVCKGDVLTHFNGDEFKGDAVALTKLIQTLHTGGEVEFTFVFNADAAVAEALRRRSMILRDTLAGESDNP